MGFGRFQAELWVVSWFGFDFTNFNKAQLTTVRFLFDALFPIMFLIVVSYMTRPVKKDILDYFYAKIHTPVQLIQANDDLAIKKNAGNMEKFMPRLLFPGTQWEIHKPQKIDYIGFFGTWGLVLLVILVLMLILNIQ